MKIKVRNFLAHVVWESDKRRFLWLLINCILSILPQFVSIYGLKIVVDLIVKESNIKNIIGVIGFLVVLECIYSFYNSLYNHYIVPQSNVRIRKHLNDRLFNKLTQLDIQCYQDKEFYDAYTLGVKDADVVVIDYIKSLETLISNIMRLLLIISMVAIIDWWILFVPLIGIIVSLLFNFGISKLTYKFSNSRTKKERYADFIKRIFFTQSYAKEMIVLPIKKLIFSEYDSINDEVKKITSKYSAKISVLDVLSNLVFNIFGFGLILCVISYRIVETQQGIGDFVALSNASLAVINSFLFVVSVFPELSKYKLYSKNIVNLLEYKSEIESPNNPIDIPNNYTIECNNVSFAYPFMSEHLVLHNINLKVEQNQKIAIVGFNGSGKTTLTNLLLRLYDPTMGEILFGGYNIKKYDLVKLRQSFNILFQDFQQYPITIAEFILMRPIKNDEDIDIIYDSLERVGLKEKIENFSLGIQTKITKEFDDDGEVFSGGEMQKLLLARVFSQPQKILILDEPSSALDALSESYIFDEILNNIVDKTVIFITHRLSAAKNADKIILMKNGEILQQGTHNELMKIDGEYKTMYEIQAKKFELDPEERISI